MEIESLVRTTWVIDNFGYPTSSKHWFDVRPPPNQLPPIDTICAPHPINSNRRNLCPWPTTDSQKYIASIYWAFTTMTTVGYGDISATTVAERIFACIGMVVGGFMFSMVVASVSKTK
eukprot:625903-Prorocentrum_minimum.AAC.2